MASAAKKSKTDSSLPVCPYGSRCYRKNPQHFKEFDHTDPATAGTSKASDTSASVSDSTASIDTSSLPVCKYGASCYRKNLLHFAEYSHPTAVTKKATAVDSDSGNDTDVISEDEDDKKIKKDGKLSRKSTDIMKRGMSLVKSYSKMTEDERKDLIKKAFEAKKKLEEELNETKTKMKEKDQKLQTLQDQDLPDMERKLVLVVQDSNTLVYIRPTQSHVKVNKGILLVDGEKEALEGTKTVYFQLKAERNFVEGSADQMHFRLAESQFYRLMSGNQTCSIKMVEYVVNPVLVKHFKEAREDLKKHRGEAMSYPVLAFHGTAEKNIKLICQTGFKVPGDKGFSHKTDTGWYGKGVYFSEYPGYSMGYIQGSQCLMLCQVLPGKVFKCSKLIHGAPLQKGNDSHMSPCGQELVVFNSHHILPAYIVYYQHKAGNFTYDTKKTKGKAVSSFVPDDNDDDDEDDYDDDQPDSIDEDDILAYFNGTKVMTAYNKAQKKKKTNVFKNKKILLSGKFTPSQKEMVALIEKHGGQNATIGNANLLVVAEDIYHAGSNKTTSAKKKSLPILPEVFVYDTINAGTFGNTENYDITFNCH